jgi:predicted DCC family thiol-disulfide oxidoreductase YuxK
MPTMPTETTIQPGQTWLFYDGDCGFCRSCVDWLKAKDRQGKLHAVPYQDAPDPPLIPPLRARAKHSVLTIGPNDDVHVAGRAVLGALDSVGWMTPLVKIASLPPLIWLVEFGYRIVAGNRSRISRVLARRRCATCGA